MNNTMKALVIITLFILGIVGYFKYSYPDYTYRYRMMVEVDIVKGTTENYDRFIHKNGWEESFIDHLHFECERRRRI